MPRRTPLPPLAAILLLALVAGIATAPGRALAQQSAPDARIEFDIPALPLDEALARYFRATGVQLLYDSGLTGGRRSQPVQGRYTPRQALRLLLAGTGLTARYSRSNAAVLAPIGSTDASPLVPLGRVVVRGEVTLGGPSALDRFRDYGVRLQRDIRSQLQADPAVAVLTFDLVVTFRIASDGHLEHVETLRGSGDRRTDRAVVEALRTFRVGEPPSDLPQPVRFALRSVR